jgi:hypothetical protein
MFGCPIWVLRGTTYASLHQDRVVLRLPAPVAARLRQRQRWKAFEPFAGRPMRDWVVVPQEVARDSRALKTWLGRAARHCGGG